MEEQSVDHGCKFSLTSSIVPLSWLSIRVCKLHRWCAVYLIYLMKLLNNCNPSLSIEHASKMFQDGF